MSSVVDIISLLEQASMKEIRKHPRAGIDPSPKRSLQPQPTTAQALLGPKTGSLVEAKMQGSAVQSRDPQRAAGPLGRSPVPSLSSITSPTTLSQQVNDLQQLCHRQQWQANAEQVLHELTEVKTSMTLHKDLLDNLIGELKGLVPALAKKAQGEDQHQAEFMEQTFAMLAGLQGQLKDLSSPNGCLNLNAMSAQLLRLERETHLKVERTKAEIILDVKQVVEEANRRQMDLLRTLLHERDQQTTELVQEEARRAGRTGNMEVESTMAHEALGKDNGSDDIFCFGGTDEKEKKTKTAKLSEKAKKRGLVEAKKGGDLDYMDKVRNKILNARKKRRCDDLPDSA